MDALAARLGAEPELAGAYSEALDRFLALGGDDFDAALAPCSTTSASAGARPRARDALGRRGGPRRARGDPARALRRVPARRADEQPRLRGPRPARALPRRPPGGRRARLARPRVPRPHGHARRRARSARRAGCTSTPAPGPTTSRARAGARAARSAPTRTSWPSGERYTTLLATGAARRTSSAASGSSPARPAAPTAGHERAPRQGARRRRTTSSGSRRSTSRGRRGGSSSSSRGAARGARPRRRARRAPSSSAARSARPGRPRPALGRPPCGRRPERLRQDDADPRADWRAAARGRHAARSGASVVFGELNQARDLFSGTLLDDFAALSGLPPGRRAHAAREVRARRRRRRPPGAVALTGRAHARRARAALGTRRQLPDPRRADEPPRPRGDRGARDGARRLRRAASSSSRTTAASSSGSSDSHHLVGRTIGVTIEAMRHDDWPACAGHLRGGPRRRHLRGRRCPPWDEWDATHLRRTAAGRPRERCRRGLGGALAGLDAAAAIAASSRTRSTCGWPARGRGVGRALLAALVRPGRRATASGRSRRGSWPATTRRSRCTPAAAFASSGRARDRAEARRLARCPPDGAPLETRPFVGPIAQRFERGPARVGGRLLVRVRLVVQVLAALGAEAGAVGAAEDLVRQRERDRVARPLRDVEHSSRRCTASSSPRPRASPPGTRGP